MGLPAKSPQAILWGPRKEGEQYSHVRDVHLIPRLSTPNPPNERCMSARVTPKQTGTDLNPAESIFGGVNLIQMRASVR